MRLRATQGHTDNRGRVYVNINTDPVGQRPTRNP